jgi:peptidoglycan/xylan/chitin deacetylase (PgdA/CDA1 family)
MNRFPVLMYHRVESPRCPVPDAEERPWAVGHGDFAAQMDHLRAAGRVGVSMARVHRTLAEGGRVPPEWVAITFDDGNQSDAREAWPILAGHGFQGTFFVCGGRVGAPGGLAREEIRSMHGAGMHIGSHAMTHRFLTTLSAREERAEIEASRKLLEDITGEAIDHFAPPGGRWGARTVDVLRDNGFVAVSSSAFGYNDAGRVRFAYRRIPVVRSTGAERFAAIVAGERSRLLPGYVRAFTLSMIRGTLGESNYARLRARSGGGMG